ncbi:TauD/TfdA dioxygenase family protein [Azospirillum doebereinerae]
MQPSVPMTTKPLHSDFATEVDVRISERLGDPAFIRQLKGVWQNSPVMIFRRQVLLEEELVAFSNEFGACEIVSRKDILSPYRPEVIYFSTLRYADGRTVGGFAGGEDVDWHSDQTFRPDPSTGAILYAVEVPRDGGDIYWADQYGAYDRLSADVKALIEGRTGRYRYAKRLALLNPAELKDQVAELAKTPDVFHPVVLQHPRTGRKALYADPTTLVAIEGLSEAENERVLPLLFEAGGDPSLVYRHKIMPGDLMMWDNGCTMHRRDTMRLDQPRLMKRTTFRLRGEEHCVPH